ncbi:MAG TPA: hypothetical protein VFF18_14810, partial [Woeseiaceae bacterium]|nr:hypothetical protein [Woeseiaceae bacterium]
AILIRLYKGSGIFFKVMDVLMGRVSQIPERYQNAIRFDPAAQPSAEWTIAGPDAAGNNG